MRWHLLRKFEYLKPGRPARAVQTFTGREDFFAERFPGMPSVPEPFFIEMIAQTGGVLYGMKLGFSKEVVLAKVESARFVREVKPPCDLVVEAGIDEEREEAAWISGVVKERGVVVAEAKLLLVAVDVLAGEAGKIVFNDGFLKYFDVANVVKASEAMV
jgi:3-hydroxymyristoyl/3-hydroxydecanoyl-(acyl carrier protein) dehydratase